MKKILTILAILGIVGIMVVTLINNKAKSEAKLKDNIVQTVFPVKVYEAKTETLSDELTMIGTVIPNNDVNILSETQGRIVKSNIEVGDRVAAGSVLFEIDDELKKASLMQAEANFEKAKKDYERYQELLKQKAITDAQMDAIVLAYKSSEASLIMAKRQLRDTKITSPVSGTVASRSVNLGSNVSNNTLVANIVDVSRMKIKINVAERDIFKMNTGDNVSVTTDLKQGVSYSAKIVSIGAKADEAHTYPVEVVLSDPSAFKAGMFARVSFTSIKATPSLVVPREAIMGSVRNASVYVTDGSKAMLKKVLCGAELSGKIEVIQGLNEGEKVIVTGQNVINDGYKVRIQQ